MEQSSKDTKKKASSIREVQAERKYTQKRAREKEKQSGSMGQIDIKKDRDYNRELHLADHLFNYK